MLRGWSTETVSDKQFDQWLDSNDTILLNALPIHYVGHDPAQQSVSAEVR